MRKIPLHGGWSRGAVLGVVTGLGVHLAMAGDPRIDAIVKYVTGPIGTVFPRASCSCS
jgi:hypothetical protein